MTSSDLIPGPRDHVVTRALEAALEGLGDAAVFEPLDAAEGPGRLARHLSAAVQQALARVAEAAPSDLRDAVRAEAEAANEILNAAGADEADDIAFPPRVLTAIRAVTSVGGLAPAPTLPKTPLGQSDLLVNMTGQPNIGSELRAELATATRVDLICAFVIMSGVAHLRDALRGVTERGGVVRVITTTYMGATERAAVDALTELGAEVKIALDGRTTKLHAKAWLLERPAGMTTAFIGSSNLSHTALFDGLEWNVRLSERDASQVIDRVRTTFEAHWESEHFARYDARNPGEAKRLDEAISRGRGGSSDIALGLFVALDVRPHGYQTKMLEDLDVARNRHQRRRNLIVAATGTGKTVVAALDYRRLCASLNPGGPRPSLLFVAHRDEILSQALGTYRTVLGDPSFGEKHVGRHRATGQHVFASIQSMARAPLPDPGAFDVVVVDEFHHAAASSYTRLLEHIEPRELLGLTATPERPDGRSILHYFDDRIASELRLWDAIQEGFLVPFQYFGVHDDVDLSGLDWQRGDYAVEALDGLYTGNHARVRRVIRALGRVIANPQAMRALGFCVSKAHAHFMAAAFSEFGLASEALTGDDAPDHRARVLGRLRNGELRCVFSVDVLGEGVDVPAVDTVLMLRPTGSSIVFAQQLGRGLRTMEGKSHLTVIDMIGQHRREFRMQDRLGVLMDRRRGSVAKQVEEHFPFLPAGCSIVLERQARESILRHLREAAKQSTLSAMERDLRQLGDDDGDLDWFLRTTGRAVDDLYRSGKATWTMVRRRAGRAVEPAPGAGRERQLLGAVRRLRHVDDTERVSRYRQWLSEEQSPDVATMSERDRRLARMLLWSLWGTEMPREGLQAAFDQVWPYAAVRGEFCELLHALDVRSNTVGRRSDLGPDVPLQVHGRYSRAEMVAALRPDADAPATPVKLQTGIHWEAAAACDLLFVTLHKSDRDYSPTTMYRDYAINAALFHWESQSAQHTGTPTVQRYINHRQRGTRVLLCVREANDDAIGETTAFTLLGPVDYVSHHSERPVSFTWKLQTPMPESLLEVARSVAVA